MKRLLPLLALAVLSRPALADGLPPNVLGALKAAQIPAASVAVVVQPVDAGKPLVAHNAAQAMNPASVMKLVTTYAALDLLGPAWTWKTTAWTEAAAVDGILSGNLYLKGSGDPRFAIEHLASLLRQLQVRGIRHIAGDVVLDRSAFDVPAIDPGAFDDKPMRPYNVGPDALLINFRALRFTLLPDGGRVRLLMETPSEGLRVDNRCAPAKAAAAATGRISSTSACFPRTAATASNSPAPTARSAARRRSTCRRCPPTPRPAGCSAPCGRSSAARWAARCAPAACRPAPASPPPTNRRRWPTPCATSTSSATT
jgi:D-alanyl-D-alanine carboxypeptidase